MSFSTVVEQANKLSVEEVVTLFDSYRMFYGMPSDRSLARDFISARLDRAESVIFIARDESHRSVGFVQIYPSFSSISASRLLILNDLFVVPEVRARGVGRALLNAARQYAESANAVGLVLETAIDNHAAQSLYRSLGYVKSEGFQQYVLPMASSGAEAR